MIFHCYSSQTLLVLQEVLAREGFRIYPLDGSTICDKRSLFEAFRRDMPLSPPLLLVNLIWDALADSLGGGLAGQPEERAAILWLDADRMLNGNLSLLTEAVEVIVGEAQNLLSPPHPVILRVFLLGDGINFPPFTRETRFV
jgi:hypothetical protein